MAQLTLGTDNNFSILDQSSNTLSEVDYDGGTAVEDSPGSDHQASGTIASVTVDANATGIGALLYVASDGHFEEADADAAASMPGMAIALESGTGTKKVLLDGFFRDDSYDWTPGSTLYAGTTAGAITDTAPSATGDQLQVVGIAYTADIICFRPQFDVAEIA